MAGVVVIVGRKVDDVSRGLDWPFLLPEELPLSCENATGCWVVTDGCFSRTFASMLLRASSGFSDDDSASERLSTFSLSLPTRGARADLQVDNFTFKDCHL